MGTEGLRAMELDDLDFWKLPGKTNWGVIASPRGGGAFCSLLVRFLVLPALLVDVAVVPVEPVVGVVFDFEGSS